MNWIRNWIFGICGTTILISAICAIAPKNATLRLIKACGTVLLIFAVFAPLKRVDLHDMERAFSEYPAVDAEEISKTNKELQIPIIEEQLKAYILQRTRQLGIDCEVSVEAGQDIDGTVKPKRILLSAPRSEQERLSALIENECGIKPSFSH